MRKGNEKKIQEKRGSKKKERPGETLQIEMKIY